MQRKHIIVAALAALALATGASMSVAANGGPKLQIDAMAGIPKALTGTAAPQRGLSGGCLPWVIGSAEVEVSGSGKVEVAFRHLQFDPTDPGVIAAGLGGTNTVPTMKVIVSCLNQNGAVQNVSTPSFPVTIGAGGGDGSTEAWVVLPSRCLAPLVFVTTTNDRWLAVASL